MEDYRNIWIVALIEKSELPVSLLKLLGYARILGDNVGSWVEVLAIGDNLGEDLGKELIQYGADNVYILKADGLEINNIEQVSKAIHRVVEDKKPEFLLFTDTTKNRAIASYLSGLLDSPIITGCIKIDIDPYDRYLRGTKPVFEGQLLAIVEAKGAGYPQIATINPLLYSLPYKDEFRSGRVNTIELDSTKLEVNTRVVGEEKISLPEPHHWKSKVVLALGSEIKNRDIVEEAKNKMARLGVYVGVTKDMVDMGLAPREYLLGPLGKIIRPDLLVQMGTPYPVERMFGFPKRPHVASVSGNSESMILKASRYYAVGDPEEILKGILSEFDKLLEG